MGYLVEKYNEAYFLRKDADGNVLPYGVEGIESFDKGDLRHHDLEILSRINFEAANVLEFGFGRGESIKYIWEQKAHSYIGVDFSEAACNIARDFLAKFSIVGPEIRCADALDFARNYAAEIIKNNAQKIDVLVMLDFVEHIPRAELVELLQTLRPVLADKAVVVVNTPDFACDNDVIADGLNQECADSSDFIPETQGMHCNRYTLNSLRYFFKKLGFSAISRGHYFTLAAATENVWNGEFSYRKHWDDARIRGVPLRGGWLPESFEIAYQLKEQAKLHHFNDGNLQGIRLYVVSSYLEYYNGGYYDKFLTDFLAKYDLSGKVIFDLGAFVGINSMQFARLVGAEGIVCAFEPNPFNADRLALNISENPELSDRIRVFPLALSNEAGSFKFKAHRNVDDGISSASYLDGAHTTMADSQLSQLGFTNIEVNATTIDEFVQHTKLIPSCIKIDIEGAEHLALAGATQTLIQHHPVLLIELHSIFCVIATLKVITPLGYVAELLHIEPDGRCFIGAVVAKGKSTSWSDDSQSGISDLLSLEMKALELIATKSKLVAVSQAAELLGDENRRIATQNQQLINDRQTLDSEIQDLSGQVQRSNNDIQQLSSENLRLAEEIQQRSLELQQANQAVSQLQTVNASLAASLYRYQMFPVIRVARKILSYLPFLANYLKRR